MIGNLQNLISKVFYTPTVTTTAVTAPKSNNPFANPFMQQTSGRNDYYGKNAPVNGGYFAGYYNNKPNIVGRRLFVEV